MNPSESEKKLYDEMYEKDKEINDQYFVDKTISREELEQKMRNLDERYKTKLFEILQAA